MPLPLVPVAVAGAAAWLAFEPGQPPATGAATAPEEKKPYVAPGPRSPIPYRPQNTSATPRAGGDPPPADPVVTLVDGTVAVVGAEAVNIGKAAAEAGGAVLLTGGTLAEGFSAAGESIGNAAASFGSSASSAAEGAAGVVGPAIVIGADVLMVGGALFTMFGGDIENVLGLHGGPLSPEFDATTPAGQFHAAAEAQVIAQSLAEEPGTKFSLKGQPTIPVDGIVPGAMGDPDAPPLTLQQARALGIGPTQLKARNRVIDLSA